MRLHDIDTALKPSAIGRGSLTLQEFASHDPYPLATLQDAILKLLSQRNDIVIFGGQAVNVYVPEPRMTQDIDVLTIHAKQVAEDIVEHLREKFHIAVRIRSIAEEKAYTVYRTMKSQKIKLVDVRQVDTLPAFHRRMGIPVVSPAQLIAGKVMAYVARQGRPKSLLDRRDIAVLLLKFPRLKALSGHVQKELERLGANQKTLDAWCEIVQSDAYQDDRDDGY